MAEYAKKSWKKWLVIYIIIGALVYGVVYYVWLAPKGSYTYGTTTEQSTPRTY